MKARDQTGAWKSTAFLSGNYTALKAQGHTAVLRTLRSVFNFHTVDAAIALSGGEGGEGHRTPSLPLGKSPCLAKSHGSPVVAPQAPPWGGGLQAAPLQPGAPGKVAPALQRFLTPAAFLWAPWHMAPRCRGDRLCNSAQKSGDLINQRANAPKQQSTSSYVQTFCKRMTNVTCCPCYICTTQTKSLQLTSFVPVLQSQGRVASLQSKSYGCPPRCQQLAGRLQTLRQGHQTPMTHK